MSVSGSMSDAMGQVSNFIKNYATQNKENNQTDSGIEVAIENFRQAPSSVESLNVFTESLGLGKNMFDAAKISESDLENFKKHVLGTFDNAIAEIPDIASQSTGIRAWFRNKLLTFAMHAIGFIHAEGLFSTSLNWLASGRVRGLVKEVLSGQNGQIDDRCLNLIRNLYIGSSPRNGDCMLYSLLQTLPHNRAGIKGLRNPDGNAIAEARDITIPRLRRAISLWHLREAARLGEKIKGLETSKVNSGKIENLKEQIKDHKDRARAVLSKGFFSEYLRPEEIGCLAKILNTDIAIVTQKGPQCVCYLHKKEGGCMCLQDLGSNITDFKERFMAALRNGPAMYGINNHMRPIVFEGSAQNSVDSSGMFQGEEMSPEIFPAGAPGQSGSTVIDDYEFPENSEEASSQGVSFSVIPRDTSDQLGSGGNAGNEVVKPNDLA